MIQTSDTDDVKQTVRLLFGAALPSGPFWLAFQSRSLKLMKTTAVIATKLVRSYSSEGLARRRYSMESAESLAKRGFVIAVRDRKGAIISIHFYGESKIPIKNRLKAGTLYSYKELIGKGYQRWSHSRLVEPERIAMDSYAASALSMREYLSAYRVLESAPFRAVMNSISQPATQLPLRHTKKARKAG